jgi:NAD(P)-dependent dehydrogenase (short-subunit alcohol dehydrogenase family)
MGLQRKAAIITGASRGIGLETARQMAQAGARVFGVARSLPDPVPDDVTMLTADVRIRSQVDDVIWRVLEEAGRVDILVSNAGVEIVKPFEEITGEEYDVMLDTNLKGTFHLIQTALPAMRHQKSGHIIIVNSVAGIRGFTEDAVYCASKYGLTGLADALDEELRGQGIRVTSIHPGATNTPLAYDSWAPPDDPRRPYFLQPEDVAEAIVYAASQPTRVVVRQIVVQPMIEPPYSDFLPVAIVEEFIPEDD